METAVIGTNAVRVVKSRKRMTMWDLGREANEAAKGDRELAALLFRRRLEKAGLNNLLDQGGPLLRDVLPGMIDAAITAAVGQAQANAFHVNRVAPVQPDPKKAGAEFRQACEAMAARDWLQARVYGGKKTYGECTREDLIGSAVRRERQAEGHTRRAKVERTMAAKLGKGQKGADVFDSAKIAALVKAAR